MRRFRPAAAAAGAGLLIVAAAVRVASLRALPIFGDEALNLRLALLAAKEPFSRIWIAFQESQPPLHVWLLALFLPLSPDPVLAGRLLSVVAGVLCVPAAAWTARRTLEAFGAEAFEPRVSEWATAALLALCPFFVFAERLARVDALFLLESTLAAGLAVDLARRASVRAGAAFGVVMGLTMLTRQAVSYPLWALPLVAWALLPPPNREPEERRRLAALAIAAAVAAVLWAPMLLAPGEPDTLTRIFHSGDYRPAMTLLTRLRMTLAAVQIAAGSFWVYLTPPVFVLAAAGGAALLASGRRRLLGYLLGWEAILLLPAAAFAGSYFPRYALPAAVPVCLLAAIGGARLWTLLAHGVRGPSSRAALAALFVLGVLGPSIVELARGERGWRDWRLLRIDRHQFFSGPPAGFASEAAADALRRIATEQPGSGPIAVLTPGISGNPTDALWILLGGDPRVRLSYATDALARPLLPDTGADGTRRLPGDARDPLARPREIPAGTPVFAVFPDPLLTRSGWVEAVPFLSRLNPRISEIARFRNPEEPGTPPNEIVVLELPAGR